MSLKNFHNIHKGETCYIFGDGPSIKFFDLKNFNNHIGIACGNLIIHNLFNDLNIKYYTIPCPWLFAHKFLQPKDLDPYVEVGDLLLHEMKKNIDIDYFINLSNFGSVFEKNFHFIHRYLYKNHPKFSILNGIDPFSGSFYSTLSLAYFMGFSKVYLIGHDAWTIKRQSSQRWYEYGYDIGPDINTSFKDPFIEIMNQKMEIYSVINDGEPIHFRSYNYEEFTGSKIEYQENNKLTSLNNLNILNTSCDYKIFK